MADGPVSVSTEWRRYGRSDGYAATECDGLSRNVATRRLLFDAAAFPNSRQWATVGPDQIIDAGRRPTSAPDRFRAG
jgi:hypothetical protein